MVKKQQKSQQSRKSGMASPTKNKRTAVKRQRLFFAALAAGIVGIAMLGVTFAAPQKPNVIVFFTDDMRRDELKFMDATNKLIRQEGVKFGSAYSNNPLCCPFRAVALTGQHTHNNGVYSNQSGKHGGVTYFNANKALPPYLQSAGYQTAYIGKYLNGYGGAKDEKNVPPGWDEWYAPYKGIYSYDDTTINHNGTESLHYGGRNVADVYADITNQTIQEFAANDKPFVMYVSHLAPHYRITEGGSNNHKMDPLPPARYINAVTAADLPAITFEKSVKDKPKWIRAEANLTKTQKQWITQHRIARAESLMAVDDAVESMVQTLEDTGELANTVIIFTSDNGYLMGEHHIDNGKILPYEVSAGVPMLASGPGFPANTWRGDVVGSVDIGATILSLTGVSVPYTIDGKPLMVEDSKRKMLLEAAPRSMKGVDNSKTWMYTGVVSQTWKYIHYYNGEKELYDMRIQNGRNELSSKDKKHPFIMKKYEEYRKRLKNCAGSNCTFDS